MPSPRVLLVALALLVGLGGASARPEQAGPLPSWNHGPAKQALRGLVSTTMQAGSPHFVAPEARSPAQVIGSTLDTTYGYDAGGQGS